MSRLAAAVVTGLAGSLALAGCAEPREDLLAAPDCSDAGRPDRTLVLMAQAVPTARHLPCLRALPTGWSVESVFVRSGSAEFALDSGRDGVRALVVSVADRCDISRATRVPTDAPGLQRWELVRQLAPRYLGERHYVAAGTCVTLGFDLRGGAGRAGPVTEGSSAIGLVTREQVRDRVRSDSQGRFELDPPAAG